MCKGPLTHSLHCSEFVELTLNIVFHVYISNFLVIFANKNYIKNHAYL